MQWNDHGQTDLIFVTIDVIWNLQLMFNAVDIIVIGDLVGASRFSGWLNHCPDQYVYQFIYWNIPWSECFICKILCGGQGIKKMSETVHTAITLALISGIIMVFVGLIFAKPVLELMDTPDDVINLSTLYMRIYFMGMPFFMLYNYGAAILRAVGDTKRPLFYLIVAGICKCRS